MLLSGARWCDRKYRRTVSMYSPFGAAFRAAGLDMLYVCELRSSLSNVHIICVSCWSKSANGVDFLCLFVAAWYVVVVLGWMLTRRRCTTQAFVFGQSALPTGLLIRFNLLVNGRTRTCWNCTSAQEFLHGACTVKFGCNFCSVLYNLPWSARTVVWKREQHCLDQSDLQRTENWQERTKLQEYERHQIPQSP